jgi:enoyl-CoA hydratase/carnithine racemase
MPRETVREERDAGVLLLTWNRPEKRNAFDARMWREARDALADAQSDDAVRAVVVTGAGDAFTAGADLSEMGAAAPGPPPPAGAAADHPFATFLDRLCAFDKPLLAAVNGVGVGIGMTLLLHCDYAYVARGARLRAPFVTLGVVPEAASSFLLPALLGWRRALDLLYESDFVPAERAVELGLATHLCERGEVVPRALEHARRLARKPLGSLRWTKRLLLATRAEAVAAARAREDAAFAVRVGSPENAEAVRAFFERRVADFSSISPRDRER